jgi:diacylglycerol kinase
MKNQSFTIKLRNALAGIRYAWQAEWNIRAHSLLGLMALIVFALLQPEPIWWALIVLCIGLVLAAEMANSAIEALIDLLHPELHPVVGRVKDMLAGMVLVVSMVAMIVAALAAASVLGWSVS